MAKHGKKLPLRRQREGVQDALLIRSAESLGRMIGSLQRQLDGATKALSSAGALKMFGMDGRGDGTPKPPAAKGRSKSGATKVRSTAERTSKRASKSAAARKTAGRSRSGASRKASKGSRRG
jgi:hypothetical protein